jgi:hypothetical protein
LHDNGKIAFIVMVLAVWKRQHAPRTLKQSRGNCAILDAFGSLGSGIRRSDFE